MRIFLLFCCLSVALLSGMARTAGASASSLEEQAEVLESSLQAVEWYTNESVRKALQAESSGDAANARVLGDKAIESDLKAQDLRAQTAAAWIKAGEPARAREAWQRAGNMAKERAELLSKRLPVLRQQWQEAQAKSDAVQSREREIIYLQGVFLTAQQWALVAGFMASAEADGKVASAWKEVGALLPVLLRDNRLQQLQDDPRLQGDSVKLADWQQRVEAASR